MENAVEAFKIGFALLVFAIAIALTFSVIAQAVSTADIIFAVNDKTNYYDYVEDTDYNVSEERIVGFETILPTIHRYAKEQYAVTIFNTNGIPIVRYDLYTEGLMQNWNETLKRMQNGDTSSIKQYNELKQYLEMVQLEVNKDLGTNVDIMKYIGTQTSANSIGSQLLYYGTAGNSNITIVAPWMGDANYDTVQRIKADMVSGGTFKKNYGSYSITYYGKNLAQFQNRKFKEKFIEIATSGQTITDGSDSIETIKGNSRLEIIYILQP